MTDARKAAEMLWRDIGPSSNITEILDKIERALTDFAAAQRVPIDREALSERMKMPPLKFPKAEAVIDKWWDHKNPHDLEVLIEQAIEAARIEARDAIAAYFEGQADIYADQPEIAERYRVRAEAIRAMTPDQLKGKPNDDR